MGGMMTAAVVSTPPVTVIVVPIAATPRTVMIARTEPREISVPMVATRTVAVRIVVAPRTIATTSAMMKEIVEEVIDQTRISEVTEVASDVVTASFCSHNQNLICSAERCSIQRHL
jgi:hypothetical protein